MRGGGFRAALPRVTDPGAPRMLPELGWLAIMLLALAAALAFEHWVVHLQMLLPALAQGAVPPWVFGSMFVPELVTCFVSGWRLRSTRWIVAYAICAATDPSALHIGDDKKTSSIC